MPRLLRTLLLLILLPGLILPGGHALRVCLCVAGCCADGSPDAGASDSCCSSEREAPDGERHGAVPECGCLRVATPEQPPLPLPDTGAGQSPALAGLDAPTADAPPACSFAAPAARGRPPPAADAPRNRPLLL